MQSRLQPYLLNLLLLILAAVLSAAVGPVFIPPATLIRMLLAHLPGLAIQANWPGTFATILFQIRLPHSALIALTGAALASSGAAYQGLFRNPLADPYLIGVASGAGLGAVMAMSLHWPSDLFGLYTVPAAAFLGAVLTVTIVYFLARIRRQRANDHLDPGGRGVQFFRHLADLVFDAALAEELQRALGWLLGGGILSGWDR